MSKIRYKAVAAGFLILILAFGIAACGNTDSVIKKTNFANKKSNGFTNKRYAVEAVYTPDIEEDRITVEDMNSAKEIIETRLVNKNITDYEVDVDKEKCQITVRIMQPIHESNTHKFMNELGEMAYLYFKREDTQEIVMTGDDVEKAVCEYSTATEEWMVALTLKPSGTEKFTAATEELAGSMGEISICLDDTVISSPLVNEPIFTNEFVISGNFDSDSAQELADKINAGHLPFGLSCDIAGD